LSLGQNTPLSSLENTLKDEVITEKNNDDNDTAVCAKVTGPQISSANFKPKTCGFKNGLD
jgi:hypothetical protein